MPRALCCKAQIWAAFRGQSQTGASNLLRRRLYVSDGKIGINRPAHVVLEPTRAVQVARHLEPGEIGHVDVEEHRVGLQARDLLERLGAAAVLTMDGDGQHSGDDIPRLLAAANRFPGWIVIGARLRKRANQPTHRRLANQFGDWGIAWGTGYQVADSQSGQRLYPAAVCALGCSGIPGEDFVFEAQLLMSAAQQLGTRCVSVPIEARYSQVHGAPDFRPSHFRPMRDLWRITSHIVLQCVRRGGLWEVHQRVRQHPPVIDDPSGEFADAPSRSLAH